MTFKSKADRAKYDRERARRLYADFRRRKNAVHRLLGGKCYLCSKSAQKGFNLHHVIYHEIESNYPRNSKSQYTRMKRVVEAEQHPERFRLLCPSCHRGVTAFNSTGVNLAHLLELLKKE